MLVGQLASMRAPARYSGTWGPGTLEITTLATWGKRSATRALPYSEVAASISQGMPMEGKSVGRMLFMRPMVVFIALLAVRMCARRLPGSARWVPRLIRLIEAWLSGRVSPCGRSEMGTAATRLLRGSFWCSSR